MMKPINYVSPFGIILFIFAAVAYYVISVMMDAMVELKMGDRLVWFAPSGALIFIVMGVAIWYMDVKINIDQGRKIIFNPSK